MLLSTDRMSIMCKEGSYQLRVSAILFLQQASTKV
jgi:hypothetical protein